MVLLGDLLYCAACERAERLLHDEYAGENFFLLHLLDVVPDRLHAGLGLVREEHVDLQGYDTARVTLLLRRRKQGRRNRGGTWSAGSSFLERLKARASRLTGSPYFSTKAARLRPMSSASLIK